jgi:hypothetical protein
LLPASVHAGSPGLFALHGNDVHTIMVGTCGSVKSNCLLMPATLNLFFE